MATELAAVFLSNWQWVLLVVLCFGSLIIALYCLLFMVPLKSFVERINSLGGGMKGIRAHVEGVKNETQKQIAAVQGRLEEEMNETHARLRSAIDSMAARVRPAQEGVQRLDEATQGFQAELRQNISDAKGLSVSLTAMHKELQELRSDFEALQAELEGSIGQTVSDSYQRLEGTVLSALEAVKDEMLRGTSVLRKPPEPAAWPPLTGSRPKSTRRHPSGKIIKAEPLFAVLEKGKGDASSERGKDEKEVGHNEGQPAPAK